MSKTKQHTRSGKPTSAEQATTTTNSSWIKWVLVFAIALVTFMVFSPSLKCDFVGNWDDNEYVNDNPLVVSNHLPVKEIFHTPVSLNYHPLTMLTLAYNYQSSKLNPLTYHQWNIWIHIFNTLLVFFFVYLLTKQNLLMAAIVSLFFGIHPMHVESVTWISERKDVLYVFFFIAGLITYLNYLKQKKIIWYLITLVLFILSCLSKAMAVVFPIILILIDYYLLHQPSLNTVFSKRNILTKIPFLFISFVFGGVAYSIQQSGNIMQAMHVFTFFERIVFAAYGSLMYIVKMIVPVNLSAFYAYPIYNSTHTVPSIYYLAPVLLIGVSAIIYFFFRKEKAVVFGSLFYLVSVALVLQFISVGNAIMADRYSYLSYVGLLFVVAFIVHHSSLKTSKLHKLFYPFILLLGVGAISFSIKTYAQTKIWNNAETLWSNAIALDPNGCYTGYVNRGYVYEKRGDNELALADFSKSLEINSGTAMAYLDRGAVYSNLGKDSLALLDFNKAIELNPSNPEQYYNRGRTLVKFKKDSLAIIDYNKAIEINPNYSLAYMNRGIVFFTRNLFDLALTDYNKAIETNPNLDIPYYNRGIIFYNRTQYDLALADFSKAISLNPNVQQYWQYSALTERALGKTTEADADDKKAQELGTPAQ